jgi:hypothetical protein
VNLADLRLTLNDLLRLAGVEENEVLVFRHRPNEPSLNRVFDWIAAERADLFDCYQSSHGPRAEAALAKAQYVVSFIRHTPRTALFVGLYQKKSSRTLTPAELMDRPLHQELMSHGMSGVRAIESRETSIEFELAPTGWHSNWGGRMIVRWPGLERSWYRWADRNVFEIESIAQESLLAPKMPAWSDLALEWRELALLPQSWCADLRNWRGVYLIIDQSDGKQYVGSAYGAENILQRWTEYSKTGHGGNVLLRRRDPSNFRFSILQRTSPDLPHADVIEIEKSWKDRLRSRSPWGLNEN